jgi:hypothetical protein
LEAKQAAGKIRRVVAGLRVRTREPRVETVAHLLREPVGQTSEYFFDRFTSGKSALSRKELLAL